MGVSMIAETSLEAFNEILPELGDRQWAVYRSIVKLQPCNNMMISKKLGKPINEITPRTHELRRKKLLGHLVVVRSHVGECPITKRQSQFWKINDNLNKQEVKQWNRTIHGQDSAVNI